MAEKDAHTEFKKRARRRLVGATALAVAAALILPMVMDREPRPTVQDIQIRIPSPDAASSAARSTPAKPSAPAPISEPAESAPAASPKSSAAAAIVAPAPAKPVVNVVPTEKPAAQSIPAEKAPVEPAKPSAPAVTKAATPQPALDREADRARAILNASGQFVVQLGVFADPANVTKVRARVKAEGYNSFVEKLEGGNKDKTRVRAGPFASRADAEKAAEKLKSAGLPGIVVTKS